MVQVPMLGKHVPSGHGNGSLDTCSATQTCLPLGSNGSEACPSGSKPDHLHFVQCFRKSIYLTGQSSAG